MCIQKKLCVGAIPALVSIIICCVLGIAFLSGCENRPGSEVTPLEANEKLLKEKLSLEGGAEKPIALVMDDCGVGKVVEFTIVEDAKDSYCILVVDDNGASYYMEISKQWGSLNILRAGDSSGEILWAYMGSQVYQKPHEQAESEH